MNPEHLLNLAEIAMVGAEPAKAFRWIIVVRHKKVLCVPRRNRIGDETIIMLLDQQQVRLGLTSDGWDTLRLSLAKYWEEQSL